ncbi:hypothetical protein [Acidipila rosea]|uniref:hypothetical protein n=1 Tax=Acidipila rosea TaxID=768535 RepID=UPI00104BFAEF|nr:hypothetical protein [Acidipila rosea]MBW4026883.1 hypothetical protein [Acidobacteriota bacterium]MBW4043462.1 hypothetical protein [Acidobacteriota bacterium]
MAALVLSLLVAVASAALTMRSDGLYCDRLASVTVLAMLAAFLMALSFRLLAKQRHFTILVALAIAALCLFADARFVIHYRGICHDLQRQFGHPG